MGLVPLPEPEPTEGSRKWLREVDVRKIIPVAHSTFELWISKGILKPYKVPGSRARFFRVEDIETLPRPEWE